MKNNKQTAVDYLLSHIWTSDWVNYTREQKLEVIEESRKMYEHQIEMVKLEAIEITIIKHCAEISTRRASSYADGYSEGYKRALEYMIDSIKNKISTKENEHIGDTNKMVDE